MNFVKSINNICNLVNFYFKPLIKIYIDVSSMFMQLNYFKIINYFYTNFKIFKNLLNSIIKNSREFKLVIHINRL